MNEYTDTVNAVFAKRLTDPNKLVGQKIAGVFVDDCNMIIKTETGQWLHVYSYVTNGYEGDYDPNICFDESEISPWTLRRADLLSAEEYSEQVKHAEKYDAFCREQQRKTEQARKREQYLRLKQEFEDESTKVK